MRRQKRDKSSRAFTRGYQIGVHGKTRDLCPYHDEDFKQAWLNGWPSSAQPSTGERVLSSGVTAVVFTVTQPLVVPELGIDATNERHHGYDKLTGRVVLQELRTTGTRDGAPFNMEMLMELAPADANVAPSMTGPGSCQEYLNLLVFIEKESKEEPAVVTSYRCMSSYVDSTGRYPSASASSILPTNFTSQPSSGGSDAADDVGCAPLSWSESLRILSQVARGASNRRGACGDAPANPIARVTVLP